MNIKTFISECKNYSQIKLYQQNWQTTIIKHKWKQAMMNKVNRIMTIISSAKISDARIIKEYYIYVYAENVDRNRN